MFQGSAVALVTPMQAKGEIDYQAFQNLLDFHLENQTDAVIVLGTTGESPAINTDEQIELIQTAVGHIDGRIPVIVGVGTNATESTKARALQAVKLGADALLIVTPYYNKPTQEGLYRHYMTIAEATNVPQILYNVPGRTGCDLLPETALRLSKVDSIVAIKETVSVDRVEELRDICPQDFIIYCGDDLHNFEYLQAGANGLISVTANAAASFLSQMCQAYTDGNIEKARAIHEQLLPLHQALFCEANPIPIKWACQQMGLIGSGIRLPLTPLAKAYYEKVHNALITSQITPIKPLGEAACG